MRPTCLVAAILMFVANVLCAAEAESPSAAAGLSEKESQEGFVSLFDGKTLNGWQGATGGYVAENGLLVCKKHGGGKLLTTKEYGDFILRFDFKLQPGGNNGVALRTPKDGNPAYMGMESQIIDNAFYADGKPFKLRPYQCHASIYGCVPAKTGHMKPAGQWNSQEISCNGSQVKITLNGVVIVDTDLAKIEEPMDGRPHPGLKRAKGFLGFLGHGSRVEFRNIRIKEL